MKRAIILGSCASVLVLGIGYSAAAQQSSPSKKPASNSASKQIITTIDGYELPGDLASAVAFEGNDLVFSGTVTGTGQARRVVRKIGPDTVDYVYTPILFKVDSVRRGTGVKAGDTVNLRALGGTVGNHVTRSETGAAPSSYTTGLRLVVFAQPSVNAGDGLTAITPNYTFAYDSTGQRVYNLAAPSNVSSVRVLNQGLATVH